LLPSVSGSASASRLTLREHTIKVNLYYFRIKKKIMIIFDKRKDYFVTFN